MNTSILSIYRGATKIIPETKGFALKRWLLRRAGAKVGNNVRICSSAFIGGCGQLTIDNDTWIGHKSTIIASSKIIIGKRVDIAPGVLITTGTHEIDFNGNRVAGPGVSKAVTIGDGCWICANSTILPGVTVGDMSLVAAGAVITKNVEPYSVVGGVPAKLLRTTPP